MLLRLDSLEGVGRFAKLNHKAEPFTELTLVFGRNGYGKSTICSVLRSISENDPSHIATRRRLQSSSDPRIQTTWHPTQTVAFGAGKWNTRPGAVHVFDQEFVNQNLHVGDSVTIDNRRKLLPVVLGREGVTLSQRIIELDKEQRELDAVMKRDGSIIRAKCPAITSDQISNYCAKEVPDDVDKRLENAERNVQLAKQSVAVQNRKNLLLIDIPTLDEFAELCTRTLASSAEDLAQKIRDHMDAHALKPPAGDRWIRYGLEHIEGNNCPFCAQSLGGIDLIQSYSAYFSEAFNRLMSDRDQLIAKLTGVVENSSIPSLIKANATDAMFWKTVCELEHPPSMSDDVQNTVFDGLRALQKLLEAKTSNPLAVINFGADERCIGAAFEAIDKYNESVGHCRSIIDHAKKEAIGVDLAKVEKTRDMWLAFAGKRTDPLKAAASNYQAAEKRRLSIEDEKKVAQAKLTSFAATTMALRQREINDLLENFGTGFSIIDAKANFRGREPNTEFAIAIGSRKVLVGEVSSTQPCFKTVLSTGDKTTLALAFFLTQVKADPDLDKSVVVFDDPFHSQDMHRQFETTSHIRSLVGAARQIIVFSHDPRFLQMIERDANHSRTRTFQILCKDDGDGSVSTWSSADELKSLYIQQSEMIREYAIRGKLLPGITYNTVHQAIRPFLEDYLKLRFPSRFATLDQIHTMAEGIRASGPEDPMYGFVGDLISLNEYTRVNMHGGGQIADPNALRAQAKKIVKIVGSY